jgi:hypothetical protein
MYYIVEPEVAGGWGEATVADRSVNPPLVSKLEYEFHGWLGDDLLRTTPCYIVTERLAIALERSGMTGFSFDDVLITRSEEFEEAESFRPTPRELPEFRWLKIHGLAGLDDFGIDNTLRQREKTAILRRRGPAAPSWTGHYRLVVSERALELLRQFSIRNAVVREFHG